MTTSQKPVNPYTSAVVVDNLVFVSGQLALDPLTSHPILDLEKATVQALQNLNKVLVEVKSSLEEVVKVTIYLKEPANLDLFNSTYAKLLKQPYPARSLVIVSNLPKQSIIMIDAIAKKR